MAKLMAKPPRWMKIVDERISDDRRSLELTIELSRWRWIDPTFWWAVIRGAK